MHNLYSKKSYSKNTVTHQITKNIFFFIFAHISTKVGEGVCATLLTIKKNILMHNLHSKKSYSKNTVTHRITKNIFFLFLLISAPQLVRVLVQLS
jgi:hypothetical protein